MIRTMIILLVSISVSAPLQGQTQADLNVVESTIHEHHHHQWEAATGNRDEFDIFFSGLFLFYKSFISSQDGNECTFTPSCSVYGIKAVKDSGLLFGMIKSFDRLTRCNGLSPEKYEYDQNTGKLYDPYH